MKFAATLFAVVCLASPCYAAPEPAPPAEAETAVEPAPIIMPMVGGPCAYETTYIVAEVAKVYETMVELRDPGGRNFNLPSTAFSELPEIGQKANVVKRQITKGTCSPLMYQYDGPFAEPEPAPEN